MTALAVSEAALLYSDGSFAMRKIMPLVAGSVFWGIYLVAWLFTIHCVRRNMTDRPRLFIRTVTVLLFPMSTTLLGLEALVTFLLIDATSLSPTSGTLDRRIRSAAVAVPATCAMNWIFPIQFLIGDAIVIWRTWILSKRSVAVYFPITLWLAALGTLFAERVVYMTADSFKKDMVVDHAYVSDLSAVNYGLSVATNATSTAITAYETWKYRQSFKQAFHYSARTCVGYVLSLFVECGLIYLCFWSISIIMSFNPEFGPELIFIEVWGLIGEQVVGLYPTTILALVELRHTRYCGADSDSVSVHRSPDLEQSEASFMSRQIHNRRSRRRSVSVGYYSFSTLDMVSQTAEMADLEVGVSRDS